MKKLLLALMLLLPFSAPAKAGVPCSVPFILTNGTLADATQVMGNFNAIINCLATGAAASGANSDITSLANLITPIPVLAPQGRLTLTAGVPVMTATVTNTQTVYYVCFHSGQFVNVYNGVNDITLSIPGCQISMVQATTGTGVLNSGQVFDIWAVNNGSVLAICVATNGAGLGWAGDAGGSNTTRGSGYTALSQGRPYLTNAQTITHCYTGATDRGPISVNQATYLGTEYTTAAGSTGMAFTGAASGGAANVLGLYNGYNKVPLFAQNFDTGISYTYASTSWRQIRGGTGDVITYVDGLADITATAFFTEICDTGSLNGCMFGLSRDWTSNQPTGGSAGTIFGPQTVQETSASVPVAGDFLPLAGVHTIFALEANTNTVANSYYGNDWDFASPSAQIISLTARLRM
jgi:hypothetical protein